MTLCLPAREEAVLAHVKVETSKTAIPGGNKSTVTTTGCLATGLLSLQRMAAYKVEHSDNLLYMFLKFCP